MSCSQNYGLLLSMGHITAPNIQGHQYGTITLGTTHTGRYGVEVIGLV